MTAYKSNPRRPHIGSSASANFVRGLLLTCSILLTGCQTPGLMAAPNIYVSGKVDPFDAVHPERQSTEASVLYATDRLSEQDADKGDIYGHLRSDSLAFGVARVTFGENESWDALVDASRTPTRSVQFTPRVSSTREVARYIPSNERLVIRNGESHLSEKATADDQTNLQTIDDILAEQFTQTDRHDVFLFVHGYNVNFDQSILTIAQIWHYFGRVGVPMAYSWPAGRGGLRGYMADRESGEFTIFHLKQLLRTLGQSSQVENVHIIAHSRGTDVVISALRELNIEFKSAGQSTQQGLKLGTVVLAAPDLDFQVVKQRFGAEGVFTAAKRFTIYISPEDKAIGLSSWLFDSVRRIGKLMTSDLSESQVERLEDNKFFEIVDARIRNNGFIGHGYFYEHPGVSSDLVLNLMEDRQAGEQHGRPLVPVGRGFWVLNDDYMKSTTQHFVSE